MTQAYPLQWPPGRPRSKHREKSQFKVSFGQARDELGEELERLGAGSVVLSTNLELRLDGLPRAGQREPDDPGAAVYFMLKGRPMTFACDRWEKVGDNIRAIGKTIEALRGIARWGSGDMMLAAFTGFEALPAPGKRPWRAVLGLKDTDHVTPADIRSRYRHLAHAKHPDHGGSAAEMAELNKARNEAILELER